MTKIDESLKYFTVLFQIRTDYFQYIKAVLLYRLRRKVEFPKAVVRLKGAKFIAREKSMDIAHLSNFYERKTTNLLLKLKPKILVDVGAHIGRFSIILAKRGSKVISIEPNKYTLEQLKKNVKLNNLQDKITIIGYGCSDKNENATLYSVPQNEGLSSLVKKENARKEKIKVKKLDTICNNLNLSPNSIDVIKIDVEGFELNVLKGALNTLKRGSPTLIVEITDKKKEKPINK